MMMGGLRLRSRGGGGDTAAPATEGGGKQAKQLGICDGERRRRTTTSKNHRATFFGAAPLRLLRELLLRSKRSGTTRCAYFLVRAASCFPVMAATFWRRVRRHKAIDRTKNHQFLAFPLVECLSHGCGGSSAVLYYRVQIISHGVALANIPNARDRLVGGGHNFSAFERHPKKTLSNGRGRVLLLL